MRRTLIFAVGATALLFVLGVDLVHCVVVGAVVITVGLLVRAMEPVEPTPDPDPLPVPYATTLLRSLTFTDPRSNDPVGDIAGRRAWKVCTQAMIDFPGDPELARFADRPADEWRFLEQRQLVNLLDRVDHLNGTRHPGLRPPPATPPPALTESPALPPDPALPPEPDRPQELR